MSRLAPKPTSGRSSPMPLSDNRLQGTSENSGHPVGPAEQYAQKLLAKSNSSLSSAEGNHLSNVPIDDFRIGERIWINGTKPGIIVFIGEVHFGSGEWAGIVLDSPTGKNNGTVQGLQYFQCEPKRGVFSRLNKLTRSPVTPSAADNVNGTNKLTTPPAAAARVVVAESKSSTPEASGSPSSGQTPRHGSSDSHTAMFPTDSTGSDNGAMPAFTVGERVTVSGYKSGILRYLGATDFAAGTWAGVELDEPIGKNDGCVAGTRYFNCRPMYGLFTPVHKLSSSVSLLAPNSPVPGASAVDARQKDVKKLIPSSRSGNDVALRRDISSPVPSNSKIRNGPNAADNLDVAKSGIQLIRESAEQATVKRADSVNSMVENDEIARRLKLFVEKLEYDKTELYHQLQEEKKKVEDLQFTLEEYAIEKSDMEVQHTKRANQVKELEEKLHKETELTDRLSRELAASKLKTNTNEAVSANGGVVLDDQIEDYLDQIEELAHKLSIAESKLSNSHAAASQVSSADIASAAAELENEKAERNRLMDKMSRLKEDFKKLSLEKEMAEKLHADIVNQRDKLAAEKSKLTVEKDKAITERDKAAAEKDKLTAEKDKAMKESAALQKRLKEAEGKFKELRDSMEQMEKTHSQQMSESRHLLESMQSDMNSMISAQKQLVPYKQQVDKLFAKVEKLSHERESLKDQVSTLQSALQNHQQLEKEHSFCKANVREIENRFMQMVKEFESEKTKLVNIVEMTKKTIQQKDWELEELRMELSNDQQAKSESGSGRSSSLQSGEQDSKILQQRVHQLEKALKESQMNANFEPGTESKIAKLLSENEAIKSQVEFLNSVIVEIQRKNVELEAWKKQQLSPANIGNSTNRHRFHLASSNQVFCDICNVHGHHDTEDCPQQEM